MLKRGRKSTEKTCLTPKSITAVGKCWVRENDLSLFCILEPETASLAELQQMKLFLKLLKKQEKELRELERKGSKRREELLQKYSVLFSEPVCYGGKKRMMPTRKTQKKR